MQAAGIICLSLADLLDIQAFDTNCHESWNNMDEAVKKEALKNC